VGLRIY